MMGTTQRQSNAQVSLDFARTKVGEPERSTIKNLRFRLSQSQSVSSSELTQMSNGFGKPSHNPLPTPKDPMLKPRPAHSPRVVEISPIQQLTPP